MYKIIPTNENFENFKFIKYCCDISFDHRYVPEEYELHPHGITLKPKQGQTPQQSYNVSVTPHYIDKLYRHIIIKNQYFFNLKFKNDVTGFCYTGLYPDSTLGSLLTFKKTFMDTEIIKPGIDTSMCVTRCFHYLSRCLHDFKQRHRLSVTFYIESHQANDNLELLQEMKSKNIHVAEFDSNSIFKK